MTIEFIVMGCGNSYGTPGIGNKWGLCDPEETRNYRTRPSACIRSASTTIIIDTGPDFREQANRHNVERVDAVIYTHSHSDHIHGIDELRAYRADQGKLIDTYGDKETMTEIEERFTYLFTEKSRFYPKVVSSHVIDDGQFNQPMTIGDITFIPFLQDHGTCKSIGIRVGDLAYSTDMMDLDQQALEVLTGIKVWIADGAGYQGQNNYVHATLHRVYELNEIIKAERVFLTHLPNFMDYKTVKAELPEGYDLCVDGLRFEINDTV